MGKGEIGEWISAEAARNHENIRRAAAALREGKLLIFPTETVYGLGASAEEDEALRAIFRAKGRPADNPLILHIASSAELSRYAECDLPGLSGLVRRFCPGPLTLILPAKDSVSRVATAGLSSVALRIPSHPLAQALLREFGGAVAAPSANRSGKPSATLAKDAFDDLKNEVAFCIDGGESEVGLESTILDLTVRPYVILRPGKISPEEIKNVLREAERNTAGLALGDLFDDTCEAAPLSAEASDVLAPKAPGMKYRHYAPEAPLTILPPHHCLSGIEISRHGRGISCPRSEEESTARAEELLFEAVRSASEERGEAHAERLRMMWPELKSGERLLGLFASPAYFEFFRSAFPFLRIVPAKPGGTYTVERAAHALFSALRRFDEAGVNMILAEAFDEGAMHDAFMNRLKKAAADEARPTTAMTKEEKKISTPS